jgi:hypothetical protein
MSRFHSASPSRWTSGVEPTTSVNSSVARMRSPPRGCPNSLISADISTRTTGTSPTTQPSWPGGTS